MPRLDQIHVTGDSDAAIKEFKNLAMVNYDKKTFYQAVRGDKIDELFCQILNSQGLELNIQRIGPGRYLLGSKQIFLKLINGKLLVRVGGGFMRAD